jgi:hypothetical protein
MNLRRGRALLKFIQKHKKNYNQTAWHILINPRSNHCQTQHCVAGFAELKAKKIKLGSKADKELSADIPEYTRGIASEYLGLTYLQSGYLFSSHRSWPEVRKVLSTGKFPKACNEEIF